MFLQAGSQTKIAVLCPFSRARVSNNAECSLIQEVRWVLGMRPYGRVVEETLGRKAQQTTSTTPAPGEKNPPLVEGTCSKDRVIFCL